MVWSNGTGNCTKYHIVIISSDNFAEVKYTVILHQKNFVLKTCIKFKCHLLASTFIIAILLTLFTLKHCKISLFHVENAGHNY